VALAVGDVAGKGLVAAARAIQVKEVLRAFARESPHSPAHIAARLNDFLCDERDLGPRQAATLTGSATTLAGALS
jgi:serine phosphatase RsbU (regulator of sigma subunit)